jgi:CheY-like chemotaxis protein/HPt (histidine-containing phosphotransfer) domain-containing protein
MRAFDLRSKIFDAREAEHYATKEAAKLREQFMANMSHEIRTPLNAIVGFCNLLSRSRLNDRERELSDNIQLASENLLSIVNDILDFSKIEAGMLILEKVPFDPNGLFYSVQQMFVEKAKQKNLSLDVHLAPGLPEQVVGDPTRLTQILINLIGNALKFTERGGIVVSVVPISRAHSSRRLTLRIEVRDSGIGIPADQLERIFERFTQSDEQTTRIYGGTGLGLSIVKGLVGAMHGVISVQSETGKGSLFTVLLPFSLETDNSPVVKTPLAAPVIVPESLDIRLLVAEDNPMNRRVVELLFEEWKCHFMMVHNGREAVDLLTQAPKSFDLVLMDIHMPEMDGYEATRQIRNKLGLNIPIVAMTAHALAGEREKCMQLGMNDYIAKPIREQELRQMIARFAKKSTDVAEPEMDRAYLEETTLGNAGYQGELAKIFLEQAPKDLDAISAALAAADLSAAAKAAHNMKSTVGYMGFAGNIGQQLTAFEKACAEQKDPSLLFKEWQMISAAVKKAKALVEKEFPV